MNLLFSVVIGFLPFAVAMTGRGGIWKFLAFLFSTVALGCFLIAPTDLLWWALVFGNWVIAWIFGGVARARRETAIASDITLRRNIRQ